MANWVTKALSAEPLTRALGAPERNDAAEPEPAGDLPRWRLLYVEDNPSNVALFRDLVALRPRYRLEVATDGLAGWAAMCAAPPDLAIVDIDLPGIDGIELCRRLRGDERTRALPLIALSANAMNDDVARARQAGFDTYLAKPLDVIRVFAEIERLLPP